MIADAVVEGTRGDTISFDVEATNTKPDGTVEPIALAGKIVRFTAKWRESDADADAAISVSSPGAITFVANVATVTIPDAATHDLPAPSSLVFDVQLEDSGSSFTLTRGLLHLERDVRRQGV